MMRIKTKGRILSLITALAMIAAVFPTIPAFAEETTTTYGAFSVTTSDGTCSYSSNVLTISGGGTYTIAMKSGTTSTSSDRIAVTASSAVTITLNSVQITSSSNSPINITGSGNVTIKLSGTNVLKSTYTGYSNGLRGIAENLNI